MTANELADLLDFDAKTLNWKAFADAATMLREQQALIKQLEKTQDYLYKTHDADKAEIDALRNQLWDLKSEPWGFDRTASHMAGEYVSYPVKEPTDLELLKMIGEKFTRFGFEGDYVVEDSELIDFARAILRKAQEK